MILYNNLSDDTLLSLLQKSDELAFTEIYERYHSVLYIFANKKLNDKLSAQDMVQDLLLNIWIKRIDLKISSSLSAYLFSSVRNKVLDVLAHRKVEEKHLYSLQDILTSYSSSDFLVREKDLKAVIDREILAMPPRMREVYLLSREEWLSNREIAHQLAISQQTVETQMKRALRLLRLRLANVLGLLLSFLVHI